MQDVAKGSPSLSRAKDSLTAREGAEGGAEAWPAWLAAVLASALLGQLLTAALRAAFAPAPGSTPAYYCQTIEGGDFSAWRPS